MTYLGEDIPKLGFGLMRLPEYEEDGKKVIDVDQVKEMVDIFIEGGFTYFDTAFGYHGGRSEKATKEVLVDRYPRETFQLATKLPAWAVDSADKAKSMLAKSLERTGAGYFDYYLLHNLGQQRTQVFEDFGIWDYILEQKKEGIIRHMGFSFHDKAEPLKRVLEAHPEVEFVQLQINYADWESPVIEARKCFEVAQEFGKPVIVMEPVRGGSLARLPQKIESILTEANPQVSASSWALRYAASLPDVITVLSGMSTPDQVRDNVSTMKDFKALDKSERQTITDVQQALAALPNIPCTDCRYCLDECPEHVKIPGALLAMNIYLTYGDLQRARESYGWNTEHGPASTCIACGACEDVCPQQIDIIDQLEKAAELLEA